MQDFKNAINFSFPTNIQIGCGVVKNLGKHLKDRNFKEPLLVTDPIVAELDFFKKIENDLKKQRVNPEVFYDIHKNPVKSDVLKGKDYYINTKRDSIVGIGGGAGMDV